VKKTQDAIKRVDQAFTRVPTNWCFCCLFSSYAFSQSGFVTADRFGGFGATIAFDFEDEKRRFYGAWSSSLNRGGSQPAGCVNSTQKKFD
jgi:hypothetical protein